jgi:hypothetical protein
MADTTIVRALFHAFHCITCLAQVTETTATDVICEARNDAVLGGLLTVFHTERSTSGITNLQNELPVCASCMTHSIAADCGCLCT